MLTKNDELFCHQIALPFNNVSDSGPGWTERVFAPFHDVEGRIMFIPGFCYNPNRNTMDASAILSIDDKTQYNIRASRELRPNIEEVKVGPISYEVLEPLKRTHFALAENKYGFSFDVEFLGVAPPIEEDLHFRHSRGRLIDNCYRYVQAGRGSGWVKIEGKTYKVEPGTWHSFRDHSWGIRGLLDQSQFEVGLQPPEVSYCMYNFLVAAFDDWVLHYFLTEDKDGRVVEFSGGIAYAWGDPRPQVRLASLEHDYQIDPESKRAKSGRVICTTRDGHKVEISIRFLGSADFGLTTGHKLNKGFIHGRWMGPSWIDGEKLDLTDSAVRKQIHVSHEMAVECRCGDKIGYGQLELVGWGKHRYGV
jgi:hypothetical protein